MLKKKDFTITKANFLEWAFNSGSDQEQESEFISLGEEVVRGLLADGKFEISVEDLFEGHFELSVIPIRYTEQADEFVDGDEICEVALEFTISLID